MYSRNGVLLKDSYWVGLLVRLLHLFVIIDSVLYLLSLRVVYC